MYENNSSKFVAVLNTKHSLPVQLNALGHLTAGLATMLPPEAGGFVAYSTHDDEFESLLSEFPFIVMMVKNSSQIRALVASCANEKLAFNTFTTTMLGTSSAQQRAATKGAKAEELDYVALVLFGTAEKVNPLTKKFSLYRSPC